MLIVKRNCSEILCRRDFQDFESTNTNLPLQPATKVSGRNFSFSSVLDPPQELRDHSFRIPKRQKFGNDEQQNHCRHGQYKTQNTGAFEMEDDEDEDE